MLCFTLILSKWESYISETILCKKTIDLIKHLWPIFNRLYQKNKVNIHSIQHRSGYYYKYKHFWGIWLSFKKKSAVIFVSWGLEEDCFSFVTAMVSFLLLQFCCWIHFVAPQFPAPPSRTSIIKDPPNDIQRYIESVDVCVSVCERGRDRDIQVNRQANRIREKRIIFCWPFSARKTGWRALCPSSFPWAAGGACVARP